MAGVLRWEQPPSRERGERRYDWARIADDLKANPGEWALVAVCPNPTTAASTARYIRNGKYKPLGAGFDAVARTVDGEPRVYACYIGEAS